MSDFKAKMHQIRFPLQGALPQTPLGELRVLPRPLAVFKRPRPTSNGKNGKGRGRKGRRWKRVRRGRGP